MVCTPAAAQLAASLARRGGAAAARMLSSLASSSRPGLRGSSSSSSRGVHTHALAAAATRRGPALLPVPASAPAGTAGPLLHQQLLRQPPRPSLRCLATSAASRKGASSSSSAAAAAASEQPPPPVLLRVPGIGKAYVDRLAAQGINSVDALADRILQQLQAVDDAAEAFTPAVRYLQGLGIKRQDHAARIVKHITAAYALDLHMHLSTAEACAQLAAPGGEGGPDVTLCVEGNISAGKSTFLEYITNGHTTLQQQLGVVHEPVDKWQCVPTVSGGTLNLLDKFYNDPEKYAYSFQNYVFMSRVMQGRDSSRMQQPVRVMERSVFSDRMVFVRAVNESGWMGDVELAVYDSWFAPLLATMPDLVPDGFIYLKCEPSTCMERLKLRGRSEENTISIDYLEGLHSKHEDWLGAGLHCSDPYRDLAQQRRRPQRAATGGGGSSGRPALLEAPSGLLLPQRPSQLLRDSLFFLDAGRSPQEMQPCLDQVPALVLDCNADVLRDLDLQRQVQDTVAEYIAFMRQRKAARALRMKEQAAAGSSSGSSSGQGYVAVLPRGTQPGEPQRGLQADATKLVRDAAHEAKMSLVANCSGVLQAGEAGDSSSSSAMSVSGSLEVLQAAVAAGSTAAAPEPSRVVLSSV